MIMEEELRPLRESLLPLVDLLPSLEVDISLAFAAVEVTRSQFGPGEGKDTTDDELAAVNLYADSATSSLEEEGGLFTILNNELLHQQDAEGIQSVLPFTKLLLTALRKLATYTAFSVTNQVVYRGARWDFLHPDASVLVSDFREGSVWMWPFFACCTDNPQCFTDIAGTDTVFPIELPAEHAAVRLDRVARSEGQCTIVLPPLLPLSVIQVIDGDTSGGTDTVQFKAICGPPLGSLFIGAAARPERGGPRAHEGLEEGSCTGVHSVHDLVSALVSALGTNTGDAAYCAQACLGLCIIAENGARQSLIGEAGIAAVLAAMDRHISHAGVCKQACGVLVNLARDDEANRAVVRAHGGLGVIVRALAAHRAAGGVCEWACGALANLAHANRQNQDAIREAGGVDQIVDTLRTHVADGPVCEWACRAACNLALNNFENALALVASGGVPHIVRALSLHCADPGVCNQACRALANLARTGDTRATIRVCMGIPAVIVAMNTHVRNGVVCGMACFALGNIADGDEDNVALAIASGGLSAVLEALRYHRSEGSLFDRASWALRNLTCPRRGLSEIGDVMGAVQVHNGEEGVCDWACRVLSTLADSDDQDREAIVEAGGVAMAVGLLARHNRSAALVKAACQLLTKLAYADRGTKLAIQAAGGVELMLTALGAFPESGDVCTEACGVLASLAPLDAAKEAMRERGVIPCVLRAMERHITDPGVCEMAAGALRNLAFHNAANQEAISAAGGVRVLVAALRAQPTEAGVCAWACGALSNLAWESPRNQEALRISGGVEAVLGAMNAHQSATDVCKNACAVIGNVARGGPGPQGTCVSAGAVRALLKTLRAHVLDSTVAGWACGALAEVMKRNVAAQDMALEDSAADILVRVVTGHADNAGLVILAAQALHWVVHQHVGNQRSAKTQGAIPILSHILASSSSTTGTPLWESVCQSIDGICGRDRTGGSGQKTESP